MAQSRVEKTLDKTRRGGLPAPTLHTCIVGSGDGRSCDGCGETIHPSERRCTVTVMPGLDRRLHDVCYDAWATFGA